MPLSLEPYESVVLVFPNSSSPPAAVPSRASQPAVSVDISRNWKVSFTGTGKSIHMDRLRSWTELGGLRYFSGQAVYEKSASVPDSMLKPGAKVYLNFGKSVPIRPHHRHYGTQAWIESPVREAAVVYVNGHRAGSVWRPSHQVCWGPSHRLHGEKLCTHRRQ